MYYVVNDDHNSMAAHLTRRDFEGFLRSAVYPMQQMRLMMMYCGMAVKRMCMLGMCVRKMRA
jgi:hypothetical protein